MTRAQKITLGVLSFIACCLSLGLVFLMSQTYPTWMQRPLGPTLAYATELQLPAVWTASPMATQPTITLAPTIAYETQTAVPPFSACTSNLQTITVLALGTDVRPGQHRAGLTDVIRAVRVDFQHQRVTTLEFPRDLWVEIPGIARTLGTDHQKLNTAYAYGGVENGPSLMTRTLHSNFGLNVDHYIIANMTVFTDVVDALGGLDITIPPGGIDGRTSSDRSERLVFAEGLQHLTGEQALTLARIRNKSVFARAEHQNLVMCALRKKIEQPETILKVPGIINSFMKNIQTDLTPEQISQLACLGTRMPRNNIVFASFPRELFHSGEVYDAVLKQNVFVWDVNFNSLRHYVAEFQTGTWPAEFEVGTPQQGTSTCE
jgi:LCP family protein required for cell wall assembly